MTTLAVIRYQSYTLLAHPVTAYANGYTQVYDTNGVSLTLHSSYVSDITNFPDQIKRAKSMYNYLDTKRLDYGGAK